MAKTKIIISVAGGNVNGVFASNLDSEIYLIDYDNLAVDPEQDCSQPIEINTIGDFGKIADREASSFPSAVKLLQYVRG